MTTYWGTFTFPWSQPIPGPHIYPPTLAVNATTGTLELFYGFTPTDAPSTLYRYAVQLDPFFLPKPPLSASTDGYALVDVSTIFQPPLHQNLVLANTGPNSVEGIAVFQTQDANANNYIKESFITGENGSLSAGASTQIAGPLNGKIENTIFEPFRTSAGALSSYGVAWDQYNPSTGAYSISFEIFNHNSGDPNFNNAGDYTPTGIVTLNEGIFASETSLPSWTFTAAGGAYVVAAAGHNSGLNQDTVSVFGYNTDSSFKSNGFTFRINPDLSAFPGDTNHITSQLDPITGQLITGSLRLVQQSSPGNLYGIAWDESITDSSGNVVGNQVEFAIFQPLVGVVARHTFQTSGPAPEKVRLQLESNNIFVLAYGDDAATHIVRFDTNGSVLATATDPTDHTFDSISILGDGRVAVLYDNTLDPSGTSQVVSHVFDFRDTGVNINDASLTDGNNKYIAGTHFNDTFIGEPNVLNEYYYVGSTTLSPAVDNFTGGSNGFNVAILPTAMSDYSITNTAGTLFVSTTIGGHFGTLIAANVQELAFNPIVEPAPQRGVIDVTGGGVYLNAPLSSSLSAMIAGSVLELASSLTSTGQVTFSNFGTSTLRLDHPASFQGTIFGSLAGDTIDLAGIDPTTTTTNFNGSALTVYSSGGIFQYQISGASGGNSFKVQSDNIGGTDLVFGIDQPPVALPDFAAVRKGGTITANVLTNDTDPDDPHSALYVSKVNGLDFNVGQLIHGAYGDLTLNSKGDYTYTETKKVASGGLDSFTYTINDGYIGGDATSTLTFSISAGPPPPSTLAPVLVGDPIEGSDQAKEHYKPQEIAQGNRSDPSDGGNDHGTNLIPTANHPYDNMPYQWAYDYVVNKFTAVHAVAAGTVVFSYDGFLNSQSFAGYGNVITIMSTVDGNTFYATYAHLAGPDGPFPKGVTNPLPNLKIGDTVSADQIIALSGDTGTLSKGVLHPHLHIQFGTELYSANLENGTASTLATSKITYNHGGIADGENNAVAPAYFHQLYMNLNNHDNSTDKFYTGIEGSDHFVANIAGDTIVTNGGADVITLDALTQPNRLPNHIELYSGASLVAAIDSAAATTLPAGVIPARAGSIVDANDVAQGGFWGVSGAPLEFGGLAPNHGTSADMSTVQNFRANSVPAGDIIDFSVSSWGSGGTNSLGGQNHGLATGNLSAISTSTVAGTSAVIQHVNPGQTVLSATNLVELTGAFADANSAIAAIHSGADQFFFSAALPNNDDAHLLIAYQDLAGNSHIMDAEFVNTSGLTTADTTHMTEYGSDMLQLTGVALASLTAAQFHFVI